jgi:hypothetical protein
MVDSDKGEAVGLSERELDSAAGLGSSPQWREEVEQVKAVLTEAKISWSGGGDELTAMDKGGGW